jgi:hypothetical protein
MTTIESVQTFSSKKLTKRQQKAEAFKSRKKRKLQNSAGEGVQAATEVIGDDTVDNAAVEQPIKKKTASTVYPTVERENNKHKTRSEANEGVTKETKRKKIKSLEDHSQITINEKDDIAKSTEKSTDDRNQIIVNEEEDVVKELNGEETTEDHQLINVNQEDEMEEQPIPLEKPSSVQQVGADDKKSKNKHAARFIVFVGRTLVVDVTNKFWQKSLKLIISPN